ncbi:MAG: hypothetical protein Q8736_02745, partial [Sweet potato little leaf phytoplasma]|nr:hypothetical protein [Sweet potato little leaf phytoplasma]
MTDEQIMEFLRSTKGINFFLFLIVGEILEVYITTTIQLSKSLYIYDNILSMVELHSPARSLLDSISTEAIKTLM